LSIFRVEVPSALKMEEICFSETLVYTSSSTRRYYPEDEHRLLLAALLVIVVVVVLIITVAALVASDWHSCFVFGKSRIRV